jgi:hypothetical protein
MGLFLNRSAYLFLLSRPIAVLFSFVPWYHVLCNKLFRILHSTWPNATLRVQILPSFVKYNCFHSLQYLNPETILLIASNIISLSPLRQQFNGLMADQFFRLIPKQILNRTAHQFQPAFKIGGKYDVRGESSMTF